MPVTIQIFRTVQNTNDRLTEKDPLTFQAEISGLPSILVDSRHRFQTIEGFGGSFTEAAADTFYKMSPEVRAEILKAYFDLQNGNGYSLCRTHINSSDFSLGNYAYTETPGDVELRHFSIERDRRQLIPMIKEAARVAGQPLKPGPHKIQGVGAGFIPDTLDLSLVDRVELATNEESIEMARRLAKEEGILAGISCGAAVAVAVRLGKLPEFAGKTLVTILPDAAERYLSTSLFEGLFDE